MIDEFPQKKKKKNVIDDVNDRQLNSSSRHKDDQTPPAKYERLLE